MADTVSFSVPYWYDLHVHVRQGVALEAYIKAQLEMGCRGILAMPNTKPPVTRVSGLPDDTGWSIEFYRDLILKAGGDAFDQLIIPLYLSAETTPDMIEKGARSGLLKACKYYPPHGTTNSDYGRPAEYFIQTDVFKAMADNNVVLCAHGEEHGLQGVDFFDAHRNAESLFYQETMPKIVDAAPGLKIVAEHITTKTAVDFVYQAGDAVAATITPQHLLYTVGDLLKGLKYHLYCMPVLKFDQDRSALLAAAVDPDTKQFFAGTDSAPHSLKATDCGCAAGCFTGGIAPQLYAEAFELAGIDLSQRSGQVAYERFLSLNGPGFYGFKAASERMTLRRQKTSVAPLVTPEGTVTPLPLGVGRSSIPWRLFI